MVIKRLIIFGSRNWPHIKPIERRIIELKPTIVVHGACYPKPGLDGDRPLISADYIAEIICRRLGIKTEPHPAKWYVDGRVDYSAGPRRNKEMAALGADLAVGFRSPGKSNGTDGMARLCEGYGIPVERVGEWP